MSDVPPRSRPPVVAIALVSVLGLGLLALIVDAVVSTFRTVDTAVSVVQATPSTGPPLDLDRFAGHPMAADLTMPEVDCALPEFARDPASLQIYYTALIGCLDAAWHPVLTAAGLPAVTPSMNTAADPGQTPCGTAEENADFTAWYCATDETLYLPVDRMTEWDGGRPNGHIGLVAHEYAHHVQTSAGLLEHLYSYWEGAGPSTAQGNELSRRFELQANCFAGLFVNAVAGRGSVSTALANGAVDSFRYAALSSTHGNLRNQTRWADRGYVKGTTSACDTWAAPADEVAD